MWHTTSRPTPRTDPKMQEINQSGMLTQLRAVLMSETRGAAAYLAAAARVAVRAKFGKNRQFGVYILVAFSGALVSTWRETGAGMSSSRIVDCGCGVGR